MTNLDCILKSRDITSSRKFHLAKAMVFPVVMYGCESWIIKKAERRRIDAFELWCWRRLLRLPWTARRAKQFILKKISPEYSLEGVMLNLKLQYVGHLIQRADSLDKTLMPEKIEGRRRRGWQRMRWLDSITDAMDGHGFEQAPGVGDRQGGLVCYNPWGCEESELSDWTGLILGSIVCGVAILFVHMARLNASPRIPLYVYFSWGGATKELLTGCGQQNYKSSHSVANTGHCLSASSPCWCEAAARLYRLHLPLVPSSVSPFLH